MDVGRDRIKRLSIKAFLYWTVVWAFYGIEVKCCEIQTLLCIYPNTPPGCKALCNCAIGSHTSTKNVVCDGVLNEIPLKQLHLSIDYVSIINNNISTIRNETFSGLYADGLYLTKNKIQTIERSAFTNTDVQLIDLSDNLITVIGQWTFNNLPRLNNLNLRNNNLSVISKGAFRDMPKGETILLQNNKIGEIQSQAFLNIGEVSNIIMSASPVKIIQSYAFSSISSDKLQIVIFDGLLERIERNAFYNITGDILVLGVSDNLSFEENFIDSYFNNIYLTQNIHSINCNCTMMWVALWLQDGRNRESIKHDASCNDQKNTLISNLTLNDFSYCRDMPDRHECHEKESVIVNCSLSFVSGNFIEWIHSRNSRHIRTLKTLTSILSIPFCSLDDIGDYTCVRTTLYFAAPYINTTTALHVKGKPVIVNRQSQENGADLELSVTVYTSDSVDIQWLLDGTELTNDSEHFINSSVVSVTITQYNTPIVVNGFITKLVIRNYNSLCTRLYRCKISNEKGTKEEVFLSRPIDIVLQPNTLCDTSSRLEIGCRLNADGAVPMYFKHSVGEKPIRTLPGTRVNNTYTLLIPFCNSQDIGDYTCYWKTDVPEFEVVSKTTTLTVNGPPLMLYHTETKVDGFIILSVMFLSYPYPKEPEWLLNGIAIVPSSEIQQTTSISVVEMNLHRVTAYVDGFISNLTIKEGKAEFGDYKCIVKNEYGASEKIITRHEGLYSSSKTVYDILPVVSGSVAAGVAVVAIILVVFSFKRRKQKTKGSSTYNESTRRSSNGEDTYDSIRISTATTEQDYIEIIE